MKNEAKRLAARLESLVLFRDLLKDEVVIRFIQLLDALCGDELNDREFVKCYSEYLYLLTKHCLMLQPPVDCTLADYLIHAVLYGENSVSQIAGQTGDRWLPDWMNRALTGELDALGEAAALTSRKIKSARLQSCAGEWPEIIENLPDWETGPKVYSIFESGKPWGASSGRLTEFYGMYGSGIFARFKGFIWERTGDHGSLRGVVDPDPVRLSDFIGYELQRNEIVENTLRFIRGFPANNLLLYGDRGTGKSSTVKALLNEYHTLGLRLIEVPKELMHDFGQILRIIRNRPQKFIIFVDDLSFDDVESSYTALKAVLEGSLESRPANLLVYATTNRRHLVRERFSDRTGMGGDANDDIHAADTMEEKLSLADRFGMTITFTAPDQEEYLRIVEGLAAKRGLSVDRDIIRKKAIQWEMLYNGRSPRTAWQFINWLEGELEMRKNSPGG